MATLTNAFRINGVVDTSRPVLENLNALCSAAGCWMTYDITTGLWSVIINRSGSSTKSFDDSNILSSINVSGTGITEAYNKVSIEFPHKDLRDQTDYIDLSIPLVDRYPNEIDNTLTISTDLVNDPVQAQYLANVELKQSRVDRVVEFRTDYSSLGVRAGDLIDITASMYGWTNKVFRVIKIDEADTDDGIIELSITALEYDADVYDTTGLVRETRSKKTGIVPKAANTAVVKSDNDATSSSLTNSLLDPTNAALIALLMNALTRSGNDSGINGPIGVSPLVYSFLTSFQSITDYTTTPTNVNLGYSKTVPLSGIYKIKYNINWGGGANGTSATGVYKTSQISYTINSGAVIGIDESATGDGHVQVYEDHIIEGVVSLTAGQTITFYFTYATDWPTAVYLVNAELLLLQRA